MTRISSASPLLALTMGDPAGIGPELLAKAVRHPAFAGKMRFALYGAPEVIQEALHRYGEGPAAVEHHIRPTSDLKPGEFPVGQADARCGEAAYQTVTAAAHDALAHQIDAIVTAPVNKYSVNLAGRPFTGHTELIAELCHVRDFAMMQSAGGLRVAFVTTHIALRDVWRFATRERIAIVTRLLVQAIREEGIDRPRIAVAAINPHAGENGFMGDEDEKTVKPVMAELRGEGFDLTGPFPPDTLFIAKTLAKFDGIVSMYHDQGHIPFKMLAFDRGVNSTLGLPIIRTSPDHGTAFEIAGTGRADTGSFFAAIELAYKRACSRKGAGR